jgi:hypothetical protein
MMNLVFSGRIRRLFSRTFQRRGTLLLLLLAAVAVVAPARADAPGLQLVYQAAFPNGSLQASVDHLRIGPMVTGDSQVANSNPTYTRLPGELLMAITHPVGLPIPMVASAGIFSTPVNFGPGSVFRLSATFRAPVGPLAISGWAIGLSARTGNADDLASATRVTAVLRTAPGGVLRLNIPFGSTLPTFVVLPTAIRDEIFSAVAPKPFTLDLSINRITGMGGATLTVDNDVFPLTFALSDFRANGGPIITAVGASIANAGAPGQTVSVHVRDFRIYA